MIGDIDIGNLFQPFFDDGHSVVWGRHIPACTSVVAPYDFRTPRPLSWRQLRAIEKTLQARLLVSDKPAEINVVGIASEGVPLATAFAAAIGRQCSSGVNLFVFNVYRRDPLECYEPPTGEAKTVIVDNAITTGATAQTVCEDLRRRGFELGGMVVLFDRCLINVNGKSEFETHGETLGCRIQGIFNVWDMVACIDDANRLRELQSHISADCRPPSYRRSAD